MIQVFLIDLKYSSHIRFHFCQIQSMKMMKFESLQKHKYCFKFEQQWFHSQHSNVTERCVKRTESGTVKSAFLLEPTSHQSIRQFSSSVKRVKLCHFYSLIEKKEFRFICGKLWIYSIEMSETETAAGLFSMPALQYNEGGWGPHEISEDFRVMPYQVCDTAML